MIRAAAAIALTAVLLPGVVHGQERFAVVVSGASGGEIYAAQHHEWRTTLLDTLRTTFGLPAPNIIALAEEYGGALQSTAANVQRAFADLRRRAGSNDVVLVVLIGHGTFDGAHAKFNLVGPDLTASQWRPLLGALPARTVIVNTTSSSFPFLEELSHRGRVVITATDSVAQRFATVFPEYFVKAIADPGSDLDKDGRVSVWETFAAASAAVKRHYEERGQLSTERPLLDDDGDRVGREAEASGSDGTLARTVYLNALPRARAADAAVAALEEQRRTIEGEIEALKGRRAAMAQDQYEVELERLLVALARVAQQIRRQS